MALASGERLGPYTIQALVGAGGMGEVYRGLDTRLGRHVALKVMSQKLVGDAANRRRFETEARAASALNHPAIVTIYDVGESDGVSWIAMEWVEGRTLRDVVAAGPLSVRHAWSIAKQVADGLAVAHAKGIVHRDLKPENVMLATDGRPKILDFGLARQTVIDLPDDANVTTAAANSPEATFAGAILGTVGYMSPEQAAGRAADFRADQFSFGLVVYELLTGRRAFGRPSPVETLSAIIREDPIPLSALCPGGSSAFQQVIDRCLAKHPADRFESTHQLVSALESLNPESPEATTRSDTQTRADPQHSTRRKRIDSRTVAIGLALCAVLAIAALAWNRFAATGQAAITSVAVLPFDNSAHDPEIDYLGDGVTESLIAHLSRVDSLKVMARGTVMRFKGDADPQHAGRTLGVGAVVTGTVTRRNEQVIISAELIDTATGERLWGQTYDRPFADLLRVQDSLVSSIADGLRLRLSGQDKQRLSGYGTENVEAYELFLKGRHLMFEDTEEGDLEARKLLLQAVEKDPNFIDAHIDISAIYARQAGNGYAPPQETLALAAEHMQKVSAIDPNNIFLRGAAAGIHFQRTWDWAAAEREYRSLANDPRVLHRTQYHFPALFFVALGRADEAVALMERALVVDPGNTESRIMLGTFLVQAGRLDEALRSYKGIGESEPRDPRPHFGAADVYKRRGDITRAIESRRKAHELAAEDDFARAFAGATTEADYEQAEVAIARLRLRDLEVLAKERYVSPLDFARLHAQVGNRERAFAALDQALKERPIGLILLKADSAWDSIRADPRFGVVVRRVGIP